jgi:hypothetical protein
VAGAAQDFQLGVRVDLKPRLLHELGGLRRVVLAGDHLDRDLVALDPGEHVRPDPGGQVGAERLLGRVVARVADDQVDERGGETAARRVVDDHLAAGQVAGGGVEQRPF